MPRVLLGDRGRGTAATADFAEYRIQILCEEVVEVYEVLVHRQVRHRLLPAIYSGEKRVHVRLRRVLGSFLVINLSPAQPPHLLQLLVLLV